MENNGIDIGLPSAPSPGLILFNCEDQSDLIFIVTLDPCCGGEPNGDHGRWRFPAHSFIIQESSPFFQSLIKQLKDNEEYKLSQSKPIVNIQCQPELFHSLMSYIYKKEVKLSCSSKCLALFESSIKFGLIDLSLICLKFLQSNVSISNVLEILKTLVQFQSNKDDLLTIKLGSKELKELETNLNHCIGQCYSLIDRAGDFILTSEGILSLDENILRSILSRDTLAVLDEMVVFECLDRWSTIQCVKRRKEVTLQNRITLLGTNIYLARYLTLPLETFQRGPYLSELLSELDKEAIRSKLIDPSFSLPRHLKPYCLDKPRSPHVTTLPLNSINSNHQYHDHESSPTTVKMKVKQMTSGIDKGNLRVLVARKSHSPFKKLLTGLGEAMICVIQLLD